MGKKQRNTGRRIGETLFEAEPAKDVAEALAKVKSRKANGLVALGGSSLVAAINFIKPL